MPKISTKGRLMPESPIRKLVPFAEKAIEQGKYIYHLNIGQPDIKTPQNVLDAVKNNSVEILSYSRSEGINSYRQKLAKYYQDTNINVSDKDIIVTTGASEALIFLFSSIMDPGDEVIIAEPFYANYIAFSTATGVKVVPAVCNIEDNFALPNIEVFEKLITPQTKAILICNPGNPTGYLYSEEEIRKLSNLALRNDLFLVADEVYREFVYDGEKHFSILEVEGMDEHAVIIDSVSKRYSMCGARIGSLVSKNKTVMSTVLKFAQARLSPPTYAQIASEAALDTPKSYFTEVNAEYLSRRNTLIKALKGIEGVKVAKPKGAFYCIAELPINDADHFAQWLLEDFDLDGETIMVAPASGFYSTPLVGKNQVRIAYVLNKESLLKATNILKEALKVYNN
ncbi:pyridoxal phosphate-dependent aminotransferase [Neotamlana laminarinivorans]|uniref:Aminotransferase n=1 Tax=Neotamlana laminarinivorans TaxID=2883124 RepID=A0A9X1I2N2_9FLAO|nr:pyridoxal phosphate-dependent aminotransferase [Tamlana laminarinivorans]MCB4798864.1 pyridoxal phosphate-dependent aminotransferase [Tamlana laminarinivorans]